MDNLDAKLNKLLDKSNKIKIKNNDTDTKKRFEKDTRFWELTKDPVKGGAAVIRFLPDVEGESFYRIYSYGFSKYSKSLNKTLWYIEDSPTTINLPDPVSELFFKYRDGTPEQKEIASLFKRNVRFITNILVVKDPAKPENEGKVFLYDCPTTVYKLVKNAENISEIEAASGVEPMECLDVYEGHNIFLQIHKKDDGWYSYDKTKIDPNPTQLADSVDKIKDILSRTYSLEEFKKPEHYKSYEELHKKLQFVLTGKTENDLKYGQQARTEVSAAQNNYAGTQSVRQEPQPVAQPNPVPQATPAQSSTPDEDISQFLDELDNIV